MSHRKVLFLNHPLQFKFIFLIVSMMAAPAVFIAICFYTLIFTLMANQIVFPEAIASNLIPVIEKTNLFMAIGLPIFLLLTVWVSLILSHRFIGPIARMEREMDIIAKGAFHHRIRLREGDYLMNLAHKMNHVVELLSTKK